MPSKASSSERDDYPLADSDVMTLWIKACWLFTLFYTINKHRYTDRQNIFCKEVTEADCSAIFSIMAASVFRALSFEPFKHIVGIFLKFQCFKTILLTLAKQMSDVCTLSVLRPT